MDNLFRTEVQKKCKKLVSVGLMCAICTVSVFSVGTLGKTVHINVDNRIISTITVDTDADKILEQAGVCVSGADTVETVENTDGSVTLNVKRMFEISVIHDGETNVLNVNSATVKDALDKAGVSVSESDIVNPSLESALEPGMSITVNRVTYRENVKTEEIPFKQVFKDTPCIKKGESKTTVTGKNGLKTITVKEMLVDGVVTQEEEINSEISEQPKDEVVLIGTQDILNAAAVCSAPVSSSSGEAKYVLSGSATAYTAHSGARTSTGTVPRQGITVAVNPRFIKYGSKLIIKSKSGSFEWHGVAEDTGGALRSGSAVVDLYMNTREACVQFGRKNVDVYVVS